jgi:prepilin-type N-terminal cleavage/methylation domain-containing protein
VKNKKNKLNMKRKSFLREKEGFTLLEVVIALAMVAIILGGIVQFSVNAIKASTKSQAMQETMDNARFAIDDLAKKVRTSSGVAVSGDGKDLFFIDNLTSTKYCYQFVVDDSGNSKMQMKSFKLMVSGENNLILNQDDYEEVTDCDSSFTALGSSSPVDLIGNSKASVDGHFSVLQTDVDSDDPHRGFVRINVDILYKKGIASGDPADSAEAHIQTGVSILDYTRETGIFGH